MGAKVCPVTDWPRRTRPLASLHESQTAARRVEVNVLVSVQPVRVLVLYSHPLMGEGLGRMLADEPGVTVLTVDAGDAAGVQSALSAQPSVIVLEEGGPLDAADVMRRSACPVLLDVDITTTRAWTLRRESLSTRPDDFLAAVRALVARPDEEDAAAPMRALALPVARGPV
jgi:DNA-binding NarL/FixJ family response regulator